MRRRRRTVHPGQAQHPALYARLVLECAALDEPDQLHFIISAPTIRTASADAIDVPLAPDARWNPPTLRDLNEDPYTTIVGARELSHVDQRPRYKRKPRRMRVGDFRPLRAAECDELIRRVVSLKDADPPMQLDTPPETRRLVTEPSPLSDGDYKHREDLLDAAICAWTAALWARWGEARCQVLGLDEAPGDGIPATIIAPCRPARRG